MIEHPAFPVEPWAVRETELHLDNLAQTESVFALANGHIGLRGNLDEGEPYGIPGTYLGGFYEIRPLPYAEAGFGYPEDGQTVVNVTNGKLIRLLVEDEPFDVRYGNLRSHERVLDLRDGVLRREVEWESPTGRAVRVRSTRLVSFTHRAVAAIEYIVEPVEGEFPVVVQSMLVGQRGGPGGQLGPARRGGAGLAAGVRPVRLRRHRARILVHHTRQSGLRMAAAMDHLVDGPEGTTTDCRGLPRPRPVRRLRRPRTRASRCGSSSSSPTGGRRSDRWRRCATRSPPPARARVHAGWEGLLKAQRSYLDDFWERSDVELDGDAELQQAIRFGAVSHPAGRRPGRAARDRRQGPDRARLRRAHLLGHRDVRAARAHLHRAPRRAPTRCAGGCRRSTWRATGPRRWGSRAPRFRGGRSTARSARATGPRARRPFTSTPTSPTR